MTHVATIHGAADPPQWPATAEAIALRSWVEPLWEEGTAAWIANVHTEVFVAQCGDVVVPVTVGCARGDSYVVSPWAHYVAYALDETRHLGPAAVWGSWLASLPLTAICRLCRFDHVVMVNNWLLSTNLYPPLERGEVQGILSAVRERWPDRGVVVRSVDEKTRAELLGWLTEWGARRVFSRRIHVVDDNRAAARRSNNKKDAKLARRSPWTKHDAVDPGRAAALYRKLYIDKYSTFNPVFRPRFLARILRDGPWKISRWERDGRTDAVIGTWTFAGVLTTPLLGYDTDRPPEDGLYRLACRGILDRALDEGVVANRSAGAAAFKQSRGASSHLEYNAVFDAHLPAWRRLPWWLVQTALDRWVVPHILAQNL